MDVLLVGADTPVGVELQRLFAQWGRHRALPLGMAASRFRSERQAKKAARKGGPEALVDLRLTTLLANGEALQPIDVERSHWLAKACAHSSIRYLLMSSDRVFSGLAQRSLRETDDCDADDEAGLALIDAETLVRDAATEATVLRTGPLFAGDADQLLGGLLRRLVAERSAHLDNSEQICPSAAADIARVVSAMLDQLSVGADGSGCFHYAAPDRTTHYGFAEVALASASQYADMGDVSLVAEEGAGVQISRILDCGRIRDAFGIKQLPWRGQINSAVKAWFRSRQHPDDSHAH